MASLRFKVNAQNLERDARVNLLAKDGEVRKDVQRRAKNVRDRARILAVTMMEDPSGELSRSIRFATVEPSGPSSVKAQVGSDLAHALWVHEGTGVYGPHRAPIVPRRAKFLYFESRKLGKFILATEVRGQPGKPYLADALSAALV